MGKMEREKDLHVLQWKEWFVLPSEVEYVGQAGYAEEKEEAMGSAQSRQRAKGVFCRCMPTEHDGPERSGVDTPLSSSRTCLHTAFIANPVPFMFVSLGQFHPVLPPNLPEWGKGWRSSIGFGALSLGHCTGLSPGHGEHSMFHAGVHRPVGMFGGAGLQHVLKMWLLVSLGRMRIFA